MKAHLVIPAFNEADRLGAVLEALAGGPWPIVVVDDGSTDGTADVARSFAERGVITLQLPANRGKGAAVWAGTLALPSETVAMLDADLLGIAPEHVAALVRPVAGGEADMTIGLFRGGRGPTDLSHRITPWVSGQRAIRRELLLSVPLVARSRQGLEAALTRAARVRGWRVRYVPWPGVTHTMKEEKHGLLRGLLARLRMYGEVLQGLVLPLGTAEAPAPAPEAADLSPVPPAE